ncbi:hypothetical protein HELRODRAFT_182853 [Helobdella robusta]|uniref:Uncharacterized protein n=1 Tax=Helobdella robusta TaxID=6412 RepID=T1FIV2_HELRO|nr:hypothetical protein HELRODRAFT_182853 [Helobdella robusta]ESN90061.1 hypothetical protein HELRODRAFT_182853 [Helobdella robusta]
MTRDLYRLSQLGRNSKIGNLPLEIGSLVKVRGRVRDSRVYMDRPTHREVVCDRIEILENRMMEISSKLERLELHTRYYQLSFPWFQYTTPTQMKENSYLDLAMALLRKKNVSSYNRNLLAKMCPDFNDYTVDKVIGELVDTGFSFKDHMDVQKFHVVEKSRKLQESIKTYLLRHADNYEGVRLAMIFRHIREELQFSALSIKALRHCLAYMVSRDELITVDNKNDLYMCIG